MNVPGNAHPLQVDRIGRILAAIGLLALAGVGVTRSLGLVLERTPDQAYSLSRNDASIMAAKAEQLVLTTTDRVDRHRADALAVRALRRDPTVVSAVTTLGIDAAIAGQAAQAGQLATYGGMLSRRNLRLQIWSIETAVAAGDYHAALRHYDETLRTQRSAAGLLFPILNDAIADPRIRSALIGLLATRPPWADAYLIQLAGNDAHADIAMQTVMELRRSGYRLPSAVMPLLVGTLVRTNRMDAAWRVYAAFHPGADRLHVRNGSFQAAPVLSTPFDWQLVSNADVSTDIEAGAGVSRLAFTLSSNANTILARQLQLLPPGNYMMQGSYSINETSSTPLYWRLTCLNGIETGRVAMATGTAATNRFSGRFKIPAGCSAQWLELFAASRDVSSGLTGSINVVVIVPST